MSNLIWDIYGCWYGKGISQPTGIIMCSVEIHYKRLDENAVWKKVGISKTAGSPIEKCTFFEWTHDILRSY